MRALALVAVLCVAGASLADVDFASAAIRAEAKVSANSNDARARFELGRILLHGWAFGKGAALPGVDESVVWPADASLRMSRVRDSVPASEEATFLKDATKHFMRAARVDSSNAIYALANAFAFEQMATNFITVIGKGNSFGDFADEEALWDKVEAEYRRAYAISRDSDLKGKFGKGPDTPVSGEAARALIRLHEQNRVRLTKAELDRLGAHLKALGS